MPRIFKFKPPLVRRNDLTVSGKSSSSWDRNELDHFGVFFKYVDFNTFFRQAPEPIPEKYRTWLTTPIENPAQSPNRAVWHIIEKLKELHASYGSSDTEGTNSLTNQLTTTFFDYFDYVSPEERVCRTRLELPFVMCGDAYDAKLSTVILDANTNLILTGSHSPGDIIAQLIPQAISVFVNNNSMRSKSGASKLDEVLIPFITMYGSTPVFYLVPITQKFVDDVAAGRSPANETVVLVYEPIPEDSLFVHMGLALPKSRPLATQAFLAFKQFLLNGEDESAFPIDLELHALHSGDRIF